MFLLHLLNILGVDVSRIMIVLLRQLCFQAHFSFCLLQISLKNLSMPEPSPHRTSAETLKVVFMVDRKPDHQNLPSNTSLQTTIQVRSLCLECFTKRTSSGSVRAAQDRGEAGGLLPCHAEECEVYRVQDHH